MGIDCEDDFALMVSNPTIAILMKHLEKRLPGISADVANEMIEEVEAERAAPEDCQNRSGDELQVMFDLAAQIEVLPSPHPQPPRPRLVKG